MRLTLLGCGSHYAIAVVIQGPALAFASDYLLGSNPVNWNSTYPNVLVDQDYIRLKWRVNGGAWQVDTDQLLTSQKILDGFAWPLFDAAPFGAGELLEIQEFIVRNGVEGTGSNILSVTMLDLQPNAFAFTDVTGATAQTLYTSNSFTVAGINGAAPIGITGGEYEKNNSGVWTTANGTVVNGDTVRVRQTSGNAGVTTNTVLTIGGISDTYSVTVAGTAFAFSTTAKNANITLSNNDKTATITGGSGARGVKSNIQLPNTKTYFEFVVGARAGTMCLGIANAAEGTSTYIGSTANSISVVSDGRVLAGNASVGNSGGTLTPGTVIGVAVDKTAKKVWFGFNGAPNTSSGGFDIATFAEFFAAGSSDATNDAWSIRTTAAALSYAIPAGYSTPS